MLVSYKKQIYSPHIILTDSFKCSYSCYLDIKMTYILFPVFVFSDSFSCFIAQSSTFSQYRHPGLLLISGGNTTLSLLCMVLYKGSRAFVLKFFSFLTRFLLLSIFCVCQILTDDFKQLLKQSLYVPWLCWKYCEVC